MTNLTQSQIQEEAKAETAILRCRGTAAEQQTALHRHDTARLQRALAAGMNGRLSTPALVALMRDMCRSKSAKIAALQVSNPLCEVRWQSTATCCPHSRTCGARAIRHGNDDGFWHAQAQSVQSSADRWICRS